MPKYNDSLIKPFYGIDFDLYDFINIRPIKSVVHLINCDGVTVKVMSRLQFSYLFLHVFCVLENVK